MRLKTIVYSSRQCLEFTEIDLERLLARARAKNRRLGVSGVLLYCKGHFMQLLEGQEVTVERLFRTIQEDERHEDVKILAKGLISGREFCDWSMAFSRVDEIFFGHLSEARWLTGSEDLPCGHARLRAFWQDNAS